MEKNKYRSDWWTGKEKDCKENIEQPSFEWMTKNAVVDSVMDIYQVLLSEFYTAQVVLGSFLSVLPICKGLSINISALRKTSEKDLHWLSYKLKY